MSNWMQKVKSKMQKKGTTGVFSGSNKKGESTSEHANRVLSNDKSSTLEKRRAILAKTFAKFRKE